METRQRLMCSTKAYCKIDRHAYGPFFLVNIRNGFPGPVRLGHERVIARNMVDMIFLHRPFSQEANLLCMFFYNL